MFIYYRTYRCTIRVALYFFQFRSSYSFVRILFHDSRDYAQTDILVRNSGNIGHDKERNK